MEEVSHELVLKDRQGWEGRVRELGGKEMAKTKRQQ